MSESTVNWDDQSKLIHDILFRFEKAFAEEHQPDVMAYLQGEGLPRWRLLTELLHSDLELRLRKGQDVRVKQYLNRFPELTNLPNELAALVATEIRVLQQIGIEVHQQEYESEYGSALGNRIGLIFKSSGVAILNISGYEVLDVIGQGGMGKVYRARHLQLQRDVAIKVIRPDRIGVESDAERYRSRFRKEAKSIAGVNHSNVVQIYEIGEQEGVLFLAMEYVEGTSLQKQINNQGVLNPQAAAKLFVKIARGVQAIHHQQIIHRDLKPDNILLDARLEPKISDFGLARYMDGTGHETEEGIPVGTPAYMSPEQASHKKEAITPLVDVYGLGATLYCALTGHAPFPKESPLVTLEKVRNENVLPIRELRREVPADLETICLKCMSKEPTKRYINAEEVAKDLERFVDNKPIYARPTSRIEKIWRWCYRHPLVAGLAGVIAVLLLSSTLISSCLTWWALDEKLRADGNAKTAQENAIAAKENAEDATRKADEAQTEKQYAKWLLGLSRVDRGMRAWTEGDAFDALHWFAEQGVADEEQQKLGSIMRFRMGTYGRNNSRYRMTQQLILEGEATHTELNYDGSRIVVASWNNKSARVWDMTSGQPIAPAIRHANYVNYASFSPDGQRFVTASWDGTARIWDATSGQPVSPEMRHQSPVPKMLMPVHTAKFSPDGRLIMTSDMLGTVRLWDGTSGKLAAPSFQHPSSLQRVTLLNSASFSPDGRFVVTASGDHTARIWDVTNGKTICPNLLHKEDVEYASFSPNGQRVLTVSKDKTARVWNATTGQPVTSGLQHQDDVLHASFSPDSQLIVTASKDKTARVWNATNGQPVASPLPHRDAVRFASFSPDGRQVVTASWDGTARVWDTTSGQPISWPLIHQDVRNVSFSPDGRCVLTSGGRIVRLWEATNHIGPFLLQHQDKVYGINFGSEAHQVVTVSKDKSARVWNAKDGQPISPPLRHHDSVVHASFSPDGRLVATASWDNTARIWDVLSGRPVSPHLEHLGFVNYVSFSPDGRYVVTASLDKTAQVWDAATGKPVLPPLRHKDTVSRASFSSDGHLVLTSSYDNTAQVWNATNGQPVSLPIIHHKRINDANFSSDGRFVVTASLDKTARVWDVISGRPVSPPLHHQGSVECASFSPDGRFVLTTSIDNTARVWDVTNGQPVSPPLEHKDFVLHASFSPDSLRVVTASRDKTARVWDAKSGQSLSPPLQHQGGVDFACFSPDGLQIVTASRDNMARVWNVAQNNLPFPDLIRISELLTMNKIDKSSGVHPLNVEDELAPWFREMKAKYPGVFSVSTEEARQWRLDQIADCCKEMNLPAAFFHQNRLLAECVRQAAAASKGNATCGFVHP